MRVGDVVGGDSDRRFSAVVHRNALLRVILTCLLALSCASCGPRMRVGASIQPYKTQMPAQPAGSTPTNGRLQTFTAQQSKLPANPLPATPQNLRNGKIYYGYYCLMCHGEKGDGNGQVGQSFVPKPTDLSSPAIRAMSDGQLYAAMLRGTGHDPVLNQTVLPEHRWPLVMHVRTLRK